jgi:hypothetical protein
MSLILLRSSLRTLTFFLSTAATAVPLCAQNDSPPPDPNFRPNPVPGEGAPVPPRPNAQSPGEMRQRPGPWNNDVLLFVVAAKQESKRSGQFPRAGVPTLARLGDGRLAAAFQHFPEDDNRNFDRVAVSFSSDEGQTWSKPEPIAVEGMESGLARPFDPTLVPLPDGKVRLYFTSNRSADFRQSTPAIYSAVSKDAVHYTFEPGVRFAVEGRIVIDCAVALHQGSYHLFVPDNGTAQSFAGGQRQRSEPPPEGKAYHATSTDGLTFSRQEDVSADGQRRWLGNVQSDGETMRFFGTGGPTGIWSATSKDGKTWEFLPDQRAVMGADPGAVKLKDGSWLLAVTGPPRGGRNAPIRPDATFSQEPRPGDPYAPQRPATAQSPVMNALDANHDGVLDAQEIENAAASLKKLDRNGDGRLSSEEIRPAAPPFGQGQGMRPGGGPNDRGRSPQTGPPPPPEQGEPPAPQPGRSQGQGRREGPEQRTEPGTRPAPGPAKD